MIHYPKAGSKHQTCSYCLDSAERTQLMTQGRDRTSRKRVAADEGQLRYMLHSEVPALVQEVVKLECFQDWCNCEVFLPNLP